jgi:PAS domain S-box-containing protein
MQQKGREDGLSPIRQAERRWVIGALALAAAIALADAVGVAPILIGVLVLPPLLVSAGAGARGTALVSICVLVLAFLLGLPEGRFGSLDHLVRVLVVIVGSSLAVWIAWLRQRAEEAEARAAFIAEAGTLLDASLDYERAAQTLARLAVPWLADWCAVHVAGAEGDIKLVAVVHTERSKEKLAWELERRYPFHIEQPFGPAHAIRTGEPQLMPAVTESAIEAIAYDDEHAALLRGLGLKSAMFVPLLARGRTLGAMAFATAESERDLDAGDLDLARNLGDRAALALDNARLYTQVSDAEAELRQTAEELQAVLQGVGSAILVEDTSGSLAFANQTAADLFGFVSVEALLGARPESVMDRFDIFDEEGKPFSLERLPARAALSGERSPVVVIRLQDKASGRERWSRVKATPILNEAGTTAFVVSIFDEITKEKRDELAERFLSDSSSVLVASIDYETTLDNVAHLAVPQFADWCVVDLVDERGSIEPVALAHADPSKIEMAEELRRRYPPSLDGPRGVATVLQTREPELYREISDELLVQSARDETHLEMLRAIGIRSAIVAPMVIGGRAIGTLTFFNAESGRLFDERDVEVARELGRRAAAAVENARLYTERAHIARTLQRSLLPPILPEIPGVEVAARFHPAGEGYDVGGDFYDVFSIGARGWALVIGDVCGKGPEAAALTGLARHTLRLAAMQEGAPSRVLALLSEAIIRQREDSEFCTAAYGHLETGGGRTSLVVASGGHPLPLLLRGDGRVEHIGRPGMLLGSVPDAKIFDQRIELAPGAVLVFYTDGVIEAGRPRGSFGAEGLRAVLGACLGLAANEVAERIYNAVTGLEPEPTDDVAILVLKVHD